MKLLQRLVIWVLILATANQILTMVIVPISKLTTRENPVQELTSHLTPYLPGHPIPGCGLVYMSEYMSCMIAGIPGTMSISLTASEYSGQIAVTFVVLTEPVTIGDLKEVYGPFEFQRNHNSWVWKWDALAVYKYQPYGHPTLLTQVSMISWRTP